MTPLRTIVVEDEQLPRLTLLQKLADLKELAEVIGSYDSYDAALQAIASQKPDLVLLDIQLQGRDAIQLLEELSRSMALPYVIFTTAYSDRSYLMSAIKLQAVDYLLKPIDKNELALAIAKAAARNGNADDIPARSGSTGEAAAPTRNTFRTATGKVFVDTADIAYIRADGNYSQLTTFDATEDILVSLATLEQSLDGNRFLRIDRSTIVNRQLVYKLNAKRRLCTLRSGSGQTVSLELSKPGLETLLKVL